MHVESAAASSQIIELPVVSVDSMHWCIASMDSMHSVPAGDGREVGGKRDQDKATLRSSSAVRFSFQHRFRSSTSSVCTVTVASSSVTRRPVT